MQQTELDYFARLVEEQRLKQTIFNTHIQLEFLSLEEEGATEKNYRQQHMKQLANRIVQINHLLDPWLNAVELDFE
ncbi:hypothetical protein [Mucilaginibacter sp. CSA2-8R]|uniref:hypothetical protein n=1 Tax=Mucilaginibacter sp. CSA2-8R TaxID=3141542 RepID=UPI00315CAC3F